jgi:Ser/Thr protein kinase RdoA (MazF antagonist)
VGLCSGSQEKTDNAAWYAFRDAYLKQRQLEQTDLDAISLFVAAHSIWFMGLHARHANIGGFNPIEDGFFDYGFCNGSKTSTPNIFSPTSSSAS